MRMGTNLGAIAGAARRVAGGRGGGGVRPGLGFAVGPTGEKVTR
jgi:hypothetical protein